MESDSVSVELGNVELLTNKMEEVHDSFKNKWDEYSHKASIVSLQPLSCNHPARTFEQQCFFEWRNITYSNHSKPVVENISGFAVPGKITAIVGTAASGKTVLLKILENRGQHQGFEGEILINGKTILSPQQGIYKTHKYKSLVTFVAKDYSAMSDVLTVREILKFVVALKVPRNVGKINPFWVSREDRLERLLTNYKLKGIEDHRYSSLSSGEKRLLSIAVQNVLYHRVLIIEYPTDDIEFGASTSLIRHLKNIAEMGISMVLSIHKPSVEELLLFDYVSILDHSRQIYFGSPNSIYDYFTNIGMELSSERQNIVACVFDMLNREKPTHIKSDTIPSPTSPVRDLGEEFNKQLENFYTPIKEREEKPFLVNSLENMHMDIYYSNYFYSIFVLLQRTYLIKIRNWKKEFLFPFFEKLLTSFYIGLMYFQLGPTNMYLRGKIFTFLNLNISVTFSLSIKTLIYQIPNMIQERNNTTFRLSAFFIAKSIEDIIDVSIFSTLFGLIVYLCVGYQYEVGKIFAFMIIFIVYHLTCVSFAQALVSLVPIPSVLNLITPVVSVMFYIASGVYGEPHTPWLSWISYLAYLYYAFRAMAINEFHGVYIHQDLNQTSTPHDFPYLIDTHGGGSGVSSGSQSNSHYTPYYNGTEYIADAFGFQDNSRSMLWVYFGILFAYFAVCKLLSYFGLRFIYGKKTPRILFRRFIDFFKKIKGYFFPTKN